MSAAQRKSQNYVDLWLGVNSNDKLLLFMLEQAEKFGGTNHDK